MYTVGAKGKLDRRTTSLGLCSQLSQKHTAISSKQDEVDNLHDSKTHADAMKRTQIDQNSSLIRYFSQLADDHESDILNLDYIEDLLKKGAKINCTDIYGQTVLHEVRPIYKHSI